MISLPRSPKQEFLYHPEREGLFPPPVVPPKLDGIFAYLRRECGGNVHGFGLVEVTASSVKDSGWSAHNTVSGTDAVYCSKDEKDTWICYDFKHRRVTPRSYSVMSAGGLPGWEHLKSWVIEVSNDGHSWTEIDRRDNNNDLNNKFATVNFEISHIPSEVFRFFRLRQTGLNHFCRNNQPGNYKVNIQALEIFGTLFEK